MKARQLMRNPSRFHTSRPTAITGIAFIVARVSQALDMFAILQIKNIGVRWKPASDGSGNVRMRPSAKFMSTTITAQGWIDVV